MAFDFFFFLVGFLPLRRRLRRDSSVNLSEDPVEASASALFSEEATDEIGANRGSDKKQATFIYYMTHSAIYGRGLHA